MSNTIRTVLLLGLLTGLLLWVGDQIGGPQGLAGALVLATIMNFGSYWFSDRIVLAMYRAQELDEQQAPEIFKMVRELVARADMPMPRILRIPTDAPNAFATGRNPAHAAVAVTDGIVRMLTPAELRGVIAHELGHVRNRDTLIMAVAATLAGVVMMVARMAYWGALFGGGRRDEDDRGGGGLEALLMVVLAPLAAMLIQMAVSRSREYEADAAAARMSGDPLSLATALEKISVGAARVPLDAGPATAHLFIVNPLRSSTIAGLFSTHPPVEERIRRLRGGQS